MLLLTSSRRKPTRNVHAKEIHMSSRTYVKYTNFIRDFSTWSLRSYWPNYSLLPQNVFRCVCFLVSSSNVLKTTFLEHLCTMTSISSIEEDFIVTTRDSFNGNPNFQAMLNGILKALHHYWKKQHKKSKTQLIKQIFVISYCLYLCLLRFKHSSPYSTAEFYQFLGKVLRGTK